MNPLLDDMIDYVLTFAGLILFIFVMGVVIYGRNYAARAAAKRQTAEMERLP
jgi:hypothetical protein